MAEFISQTIMSISAIKSRIGDQCSKSAFQENGVLLIFSYNTFAFYKI